ncbi:MAG: beta-lactamase family protein [Brevefilum sp.]|nr:beta-lactamase family protein [Brevefilum sp.]
MKKTNHNEPIHPKNRAAGHEALDVRLEGLLQEMMSQKMVHSALVAVEKMDGSFRWVATAGDAQPDGSPLLPDTPFFIASVTKLYIASTILKLHERGQVGLDQPISTYLPQALIGGLHRFDGVDYTEQVTVRHLLGHSSGLPEYLEDKPKGGRTFVDRILEQDFVFTIEDILDAVRELPPHFPPQPYDKPQQKVRYCDTNYQLLIAIIEALTGGSLHAAFTDLLYQPLGLGDTYHPGTRADAPEPAGLWIDEQPLHIPLAMRSFGDLVSTLDDMLQFMRGLVRGEVFDDPATLDLMLGHWNTFGVSLNPVKLSPGWPIAYGLGMMRFKIPRPFSGFRAIPAVVGHSGATGSWLFYCDDLDVLLAGSVNQLSAGAVPFRYIPKMLQAVAAAGV